MIQNASSTAAGTVTLHCTVNRRDEQQEIEQERKEMLQLKEDLERRELALQKKHGIVAQVEYQMKNREIECNRWERSIKQNRMALQKEVNRKKGVEGRVGEQRDTVASNAQRKRRESGAGEAGAGSLTASRMRSSGRIRCSQSCWSTVQEQRARLGSKTIYVKCWR